VKVRGSVGLTTGPGVWYRIALPAVLYMTTVVPGLKSMLRPEYRLKVRVPPWKAL
jgi:hypothetical protein